MDLTLARCFFDNPLDVPYIPQEGTGAARFANDCGAACVAMLLAYAGIRPPSVDTLAAQTTLAQTDNGLSTQQVCTLARIHGLQCQVVNDLTVEKCRSEIRAGRPLIALIRYGCISGRKNQADRAGHFVVVTGFDDVSIFINDPDWWGADVERGHQYAVPVQEWLCALVSSPVPGQGIVLG